MANINLSQIFMDLNHDIELTHNDAVSLLDIVMDSEDLQIHKDMIMHYIRRIYDRTEKYQ